MPLSDTLSTEERALRSAIAYKLTNLGRPTSPEEVSNACEDENLLVFPDKKILDQGALEDMLSALKLKKAESRTELFKHLRRTYKLDPGSVRDPASAPAPTKNSRPKFRLGIWPSLGLGAAAVLTIALTWWRGQKLPALQVTKAGLGDILATDPMVLAFLGIAVGALMLILGSRRGNSSLSIAGTAVGVAAMAWVLCLAGMSWRDSKQAQQVKESPTAVEAPAPTPQPQAVPTEQPQAVEPPKAAEPETIAKDAPASTPTPGPRPNPRRAAAPKRAKTEQEEARPPIFLQFDPGSNSLVEAPKK